jgi:hypothetical protein
MVSLRALGRTLVLAAAVLAAVLPASARTPGEDGPTVGPEVPVSRPVPGAPRVADDQAVASGGGVFLVAWIDIREHLWVTRVDRNGAVVDQSGIQLSAEYSHAPTVAFDGTNFLVAWGGSGPIQARRVSPGGAVLDPEPIVLSSTPGVPEVSFGGGTYLVVWDRFDSGSESAVIAGTRLRPDGVVLRPADVLILDPGDSSQHQIDIAFDGTHHLLVWDQGDPWSSDVHGTLVGTDGVAVGPVQPISTAVGEQRRPVVASTGSGFFVAWEDRVQGYDVYGARVRPDGSVVDAAGIRIGAAADSFYYAPHDVTWDGVDVLVTWQAGAFGQESIRGTRVDPSGTVLDPDGVELADGFHPATAFDGTRHLVTSAIRLYARDIVAGARVTPGLAPLDPDGFTVAVGADQQSDLDVVSDGANHFAVWVDNRTGSPAVYGGRIGPEGQLLDGAGFAVSVPAESYVEGPSVAFDGTNFLVVWVERPRNDANFLRAARISRSGAILERFDIDQPSYISIPEVEFGNGVFLVVWARFEVLVAARVTPDGSVLDPGGFELGWSYLTTVPEIDVAAGAAEFLVVLQTGRSTDTGSDNNVYGVVVTPEGTVAAGRIVVATGELDQSHPRVAWQDGTYLVVWHAADDDYWPPGSADIVGARLDGSGTVLDPAGIPVSTAPNDQQQPDVAGAGGRFLVTWNDRRRSADFYDAEVHGTRVDPDATVWPDFLISPSGLNGGESVVAAHPGTDDFTVGYGRYLPEEPYGTNRAFLRQVAPK